ncbi:hypothetical protein D3C81_1725030 [compost metagenome]
MDMLGENFKTDMMPSYIIDLSKQVLLGDSPSISGFTIMGEGFRKNGVFYDAANEEDVQYAQEMIKSWTDAKTEPSQLLMPESRDAEASSTDSSSNQAGSKE